jgi:class 3 adenylate cyclase
VAEDTRSGEAPLPVSGADIRTFLFADMRGYTRFTQELGDDAASALAARFADLVRDTVPELGGELLELRGDEALCVFRSARQALSASIELQRRLRTTSVDEQAFPLGVGMGLDAGEAVPTQGGYRGAALNLAARLCALAKPGQILATEGVSHLARRVPGVRTSSPRMVTVKGILEPVRVVEVTPELPLPPLPAATAPPTRGHRWRIMRVGAAAIVVAVLGFVALTLMADHGRNSAGGVVIRSDSLVVFDTGTGNVVRDIPLGTRPAEVTAGAKAIWVGSDADQTVTRVDPRAFRVARPIGLGIDPAQMTVAFGSLWVYDAVENRLAVVDPTGRTPPSFPTPLPRCPRVSDLSGQRLCGYGGITADSKGIWLGRACARACAPPDFGWAWRIDPVSYERTRPIINVPSDRMAFGAGTLWAYGSNGFWVAQIDSAGRLRRYPLPDYVSASYNQPGLAVAFGAAWVASPDASPGSALFEYTSSGDQRSLPVPPGAYEVVAGDNLLWVLSSSGTLTKVNPYTSHVGPTYSLRHAAQGIAYYDHRIWITVGQPAGAG